MYTPDPNLAGLPNVLRALRRNTKPTIRGEFESLVKEHIPASRFSRQELEKSVEDAWGDKTPSF